MAPSVRTTTKERTKECREKVLSARKRKATAPVSPISSGKKAKSTHDTPPAAPRDNREPASDVDEEEDRDEYIAELEGKLNETEKALEQAVAAEEYEKSLLKNAGMHDAIQEIIKHKLFKKVKFVRDEAQAKEFAGYIWGQMDPNLQGMISGERFQVVFMWKCLAMLNEFRHYTQAQMKKAFGRYWVKHFESIPTLNEIKACAFRTIDPKDKRQCAVMDWYWDVLLGYATGNTNDWSDDKKHYCRITTAGWGGTDGNRYPFIPASTEAWLLLAYDSNEHRWPKLFEMDKAKPGVLKVFTTKPSKKLKKKEKKGEVVICSDPEFQAKYTTSTGGHKKFGGWSDDSMDVFDNYRKTIAAARATRGGKEIERACLKRVRHQNGRYCKSLQEDRLFKRRRKNKQSVRTGPAKDVIDREEELAEEESDLELEDGPEEEEDDDEEEEETKKQGKGDEDSDDDDETKEGGDDE